VRPKDQYYFDKRRKEAGAANVDMAFASPPVPNQWRHGVAMRRRKDLQLSLKEFLLRGLTKKVVTNI